MSSSTCDAPGHLVPASRGHGANFTIEEPVIPKPARRHGPQSDARFQLYQRQPRADKLDTRQRSLCHADHAYRAVLQNRVANPDRFDAFLHGVASYIDFDRPCPKCEGYRRRVRDRSCYTCHLSRGSQNFARMKAGIAPIKQRSQASHLDLLRRQRAEKDGECITRTFGGITAIRWPTGRLEVHLPDGDSTPDLAKGMSPKGVWQLAQQMPDMMDVLVWAGWY